MHLIDGTTRWLTSYVENCNTSRDNVRWDYVFYRRLQNDDVYVWALEKLLVVEAGEYEYLTKMTSAWRILLCETETMEGECEGEAMISVHSSCRGQILLDSITGEVSYRMYLS